MIVAFCSVKGAPGVSSWSVLTAGMWPSESDLDIAVLEADVAGGVMASRYGVGVSPGAVDLAVALTRDPRSVPVERCGRRVGERAWLVPEPTVPNEALAGWSDGTEATAMALAADERMWFVDIGRFSSIAWPWIEHAAQVRVVTTSALEHLVVVAPVVAELQAVAATEALVVGRTDHPEDEVAEFLGCSVRSLTARPVVEDSRRVWDGTAKWRRSRQLTQASELAWSLHETASLAAELSS